MHVPTIIGGILGGWPVGAVIGLVFGGGAFILAESPIFKDPLVAIVPRIFIGVTSYLTYHVLRQASSGWMGVFAILLVALGAYFSYQVATVANLGYGVLTAILLLSIGAALGYLAWQKQAEVVAISVAAAVGTLTNTVGVLTMAVVRGYLSAEVALGIGILHGIPEVVVAVIVTVAVVVAWKRIETGSGKSKL